MFLIIVSVATEKESAMGPVEATMNEDDLVHVPHHQIQIVNVPVDQTVEIVMLKKKNTAQVDEIHGPEKFRAENVHHHVKYPDLDENVVEVENVQSCNYIYYFFEILQLYLILYFF